MAYQQQPNMQYPQQIPDNTTHDAPQTQQYSQPPNIPFPGHQGPIQPHNVPNQPPPPMRINGQIIYNAHTNQPIYTYTTSQAPGSDLPDSLVVLKHVATGVTVGSTRRHGSGKCFGCCGCCTSEPEEDVVSVGLQGDKAVIRDLGLGKKCWGWTPTWKGGPGVEWGFFREDGLVLRDAVSGGREVFRVRSGGEVVFGEVGMGLNEEQVGECLLVLVSMRVERNEGSMDWLLLFACCW